MIILVPWKPVVVIWLLLSAVLWYGYVGSLLTEGKNPFAPYPLQAPHDRHSAIQIARCIIRRIARTPVIV